VECIYLFLFWADLPDVVLGQKLPNQRLVGVETRPGKLKKANTLLCITLQHYCEQPKKTFQLSIDGLVFWANTERQILCAEISLELTVASWPA
jgi:hypothetical protein